jgi:hypothetical protein
MYVQKEITKTVRNAVTPFQHTFAHDKSNPSTLAENVVATPLQQC